MGKSLNFIWRLTGTALSFTLFGIGGVFIGLTLWLLSSLRLLPQEQFIPQARQLVSNAFYLYINFMRDIGLLTYEIQGREKLTANKTQLIIANHPSLLDVVFLISLIPQANCVVKSALWRNFFTRPPVKAANFISNESKTLIEEGVSSLAKGETLVVFPEGTRTVPGQPLKLFRGAANIAILSNTPLTPIFISCKPETLLKKQNWYNIPPQAPHFTIKVLDPIAIDAYINNGETQSKNARNLTKQIKNFYEDLIQAQSSSSN